MKFSEAAQSFLNTRTAPITHGRVQYISNATFKDYRKKLKALGVFFADTRLEDIHIGSFTEYQDRRARGEGYTRKIGRNIVQSPAGAQKINAELSLMERILKLAGTWTPELEQFYLPFQVMETDVPRSLSQEQQDHFLMTASSRQEWHPIWWYSLVALDLTFSSDEMRTIRQGDVNLTHQIVGVNRRYGKNKFRRRDVPIADGACVWALQRLLERAKDLVGNQPHFYLFPGRIVRNVFDGETHMSETGLRKPFEAVREKSEVPWFQLNGWRHTAITRLAEAGVPIATIMRRAGHVTPKMSEHYTHISEQAERLAVGAAFQRKPVISIQAAQLRKRVSGY